MSLRSLLVPLAVVLLSFGQLILKGREATKIVSENLKNPLASSGLRLVDLVAETPPTARIHEVTFTFRGSGDTFAGQNARLKIQLWSKGRTRIVVVRPAGSDPSRRQALLDVFRRRGRLRVVADREWIDLGPTPAGDGTMAVQVAGLLPGPFGLAELRAPADPVFDAIQVRRDGAAAAEPAPLRYRISAAAPVAAAETLARFFFFVSVSPVLEVTGLASLVLLLTGWWLLGRDRVTAAVCCLVASVVLLHAVCLPPLQGADETSHGATIEALLFRGMPVKENDPYPRSWSLAAEALEQDRIQYQPEEPLPLEGRPGREILAARLTRSLRSEALEEGPSAPVAGVQGITKRSPLYFLPFSWVGGLLRPLTLIDRIGAFRVLSSLSGLLLFCAGAWLLRRSGMDPGVVLPFGLVWLVPYMVFATASISNYAPAVGLGCLLAAAALVSILSDTAAMRAVAAGILVLGSWGGILVWPDFVFLAPLVTVALALGGLRAATRGLRPVLRGALRGLALLLAVAGLIGFGLLLSRIAFENIGTRRPLELPGILGPDAIRIGAVVATPFALAALLALALRTIGTLPPHEARRIAPRASVALALLLVAGFLLTPWTSIPYETDRYWFTKFLRESVKVFLSSSLAWDQDTLSWKFYLGVGGWHDLFYPGWLYAATKWLLVALLVWLPARLIRAAAPPDGRMSALVLVSGLGASLSVATLTLRYFAPVSPFGRFALPWLALVLLPLFAVVGSGPGSKGLRLAIRIGVLLQIWTAISLVGTRYLFGLG